MKRPELLIPASSLEVLRVAVLYGADAVYIGGEAFGLRAKAKNFTPEEMAEGIVFAHDRGVKVYVTANIFAHNGDLEDAFAYFGQLRDLKTRDGRMAAPDALIISDPGMFVLAKRPGRMRKSTSQPRPTAPTMRRGISGGIGGLNGWFRPGNCPWRRSVR